MYLYNLFFKGKRMIFYFSSEICTKKGRSLFCFWINPQVVYSSGRRNYDDCESITMDGTNGLMAII